MQHAIPFQEYPSRDIYMTREETAQALGVSTRCLDNHAKRTDGKAPPYMMWRNRAWYKASDVAAYKERMAEAAPYTGPRPEPKIELYAVPEREELELADPFLNLAEQVAKVRDAMRELQAKLEGMGR